MTSSMAVHLSKCMNVTLSSKYAIIRLLLSVLTWVFDKKIIYQGVDISEYNCGKLNNLMDISNFYENKL